MNRFLSHRFRIEAFEEYLAARKVAPVLFVHPKVLTKSSDIIESQGMVFQSLSSEESLSSLPKPHLVRSDDGLTYCFIVSIYKADALY
jgi:hypothetical protein